MHPFVRQYLKSSLPVAILARQTPEPRDPVVAAIVLLAEVQQRDRPYEEAAAALQRLDLGSCDPSLHTILLEEWATVANDNRRYGEVLALARRARGLISRQTPPEIQAMVRAMESFRAVVGGDLAKRAEALQEALELFPPASPRRPLALLNHAWSYATQGRLADIASKFRDAPRDGEYTNIVRMIEFIDHVETGRAGEAARLAAELGPPWQPHWREGRLARQRSSYRTGRALAAMVAGDASLERAWRELGLGDPQDPDFAGNEIAPTRLPEWVLVLHHLAERRPDRALEHARRQAVEWGETMPRETGIVSLNLLRSELACAHAEAARRVLDQRRDIGNVHYLDDLFLARLELLAGRREAAAGHFAAALAAADRYDAHGRLDFELRTACELSPGSLARLGRAAGALQPKRSAGPVGIVGPSERPGERPAVGRGPQLVGASAALARLRSDIDRFAASDVPVLVAGETGTGKELVARMLHELGPRRERPFVAINCGAIAETLLESELFGHEKGAFTGAEGRHRGIFEEAADGTVFLDEIGEISPRLQVMLLRVLETGEIRPVGGARSRKTVGRVIAATNANLERMVEAGRFRKDLYYRLKRLELQLPPLRERPEDVVPLVRHFLSQGRADGGRPAVSERLGRWLSAREWPGNVRELRNFVERLRLLNSEKLEYDLADLPAGLGAEAEAGAGAGVRPGEAPSTVSAVPTAPARIATGGDEAAPPPGDASPATAGAAETAVRDEAAFLARGRSPLRRRDRLRALFARHGKLTRQELATLLGVSLDTAGRDLRLLCVEKLVEKVEPTASPRTHYFRLRSPGGAP